MLSVFKGSSIRFRDLEYITVFFNEARRNLVLIMENYVVNT